MPWDIDKLRQWEPDDGFVLTYSKAIVQAWLVRSPDFVDSDLKIRVGGGVWVWDLPEIEDEDDE